MDSISNAWRQLRRTPDAATVWLDLAREYARLNLAWQMDYAARQAHRIDRELEAALTELGMASWQETARQDELLGHAGWQAAPERVAEYVAAVDAHPGDWLSWLYLARLHEMAGDANSAKEALAVAQALEPMPGESLHALGGWRLRAGDAAGAVAALARLVDLRPVRFSSMLTLGEALLLVGNVAAAEKAFTRASASPNPEFLVRLATKVFTLNYWQEATAILRKALSLQPENVAAWVQLSRVHWEVYDLDAAVECCKRILSLEPGQKDATYMLNALHGRMGDAQSYLGAVRAEYVKAGEPRSRLASSIAMGLLYSDALTPEAVAAEHRRLVEPLEAAHPDAARFSPARRAGDGRLRVGYVSADLYRQHPVNLFLLPVLLHHDRSRFDVFFYQTGVFVDEYTRQAKAAVAHWVEATGWTDADLQARIMADGIDVLVDLAGHTSTHRLGLFAMRAAPVQATFLGYPHSTAMTRMDWFVGDSVVTPAAHAPLYGEGLAQLPHGVFCWTPVDDYPMPAQRPSDAPVVFGSFNNVLKLSPTTISLWARVLQAVPNSRLLLKSPSFRSPGVQARFMKLFGECGIPAERLAFRGPSGLEDMMQEYGDIDIALDPLPYNGGTTSLQALWMGVPLVTLEGGNFVSRMGSSFLQTMGRAEWVAHDAGEYVAIAVRLAENMAAVRAGRAALRAQMAASALCDITTYTRDLENLFERMWTAYETGSGERFLGGVGWVER